MSTYQRAPIVQPLQQQIQPGMQQGIIQPGVQQGIIQPGVQQAGVIQPGVQQAGVVQPGVQQIQPGMQQGGIQPGVQYGKPMQSQVYQNTANLHAPAGVGSSLAELSAQKGVLPQQGLAQKTELQPQLGQLQPLKLLVSGKELLLKPNLMYTIGSAPDANIHVGGSLTNKIPTRAAIIENNLLKLEPIANIGGTDQWEQLYLNGRTLHPGIDTLLRDGDMIRLGHHEMRITDVHTINPGVRHEASTAIPPAVAPTKGLAGAGVVPGTKEPVESVDSRNLDAPNTVAAAAVPVPVSAPKEKEMDTTSTQTTAPPVEKPIPTEPQPMPPIGEFYFTTLKQTTTTAVRNSAMEPSASSESEARRYPGESTVGERNAAAAAQQPWEMVSQRSQLAPGQSTTLADGTEVSAGNQPININATRRDLD